MALRMKAGGPTSVITPAEAKKLGLLKTTVAVTAEKPKAADKPKTGGVSAQKEEKKGAPSNKENVDDDNPKKAKVIAPAAKNGISAANKG